MTHTIEILLHGPAGVEHRTKSVSTPEVNAALAEKLAAGRYELAGTKFPLPPAAAEKAGEIGGPPLNPPIAK